eukprot:scaffold60014_cov25-Tisochrysis_lutea.AAC.1
MCVRRSSSSSSVASPWSIPCALTALPIPPMSNLPLPKAVPPSATQCLTHAAIGTPLRWIPRTSAAASSPASAGSSEKHSYARPHRRSCATAAHGENIQLIPQACDSSAAMRASCSTSCGSSMHPWPTWCGKSVASRRLAWPWTVSLQTSIGSPAPTPRAARCSAALWRCQLAGTFGIGAAPPPPSTEPSPCRPSPREQASRERGPLRERLMAEEARGGSREQAALSSLGKERKLRQSGCIS